MKRGVATTTSMRHKQTVRVRFVWGFPSFTRIYALRTKLSHFLNKMAGKIKAHSLVPLIQ